MGIKLTGTYATGLQVPMFCSLGYPLPHREQFREVEGRGKWKKQYADFTQQIIQKGKWLESVES